MKVEVMFVQSLWDVEGVVPYGVSVNNLPLPIGTQAFHCVSGRQRATEPCLLRLHTLFTVFTYGKNTYDV